MCGICGVFDLNGASSPEILQEMTNALRHRGPDDFGYLVGKSGNVFTGLGHRRLSIIDLSPLGRQPMVFENIEVVFNGEIYNFQEIRRELEEQGYSFLSNSDTEVILKAFHCWGISCLNIFNGMFAIVINDKAANKVFLIRDRSGVKPLYWYLENGLFLFSSELKSFHKHPRFKKELDFNSLALYFRHGYIPQPFCIFQNTKKLLAGHYIELDLKSFALKEFKYWDISDYYQKPRLKISFEDSVSEAQRLLHSACEYRMISDVPVGIFLSGGYDSSAISAILQANRSKKIKTITIGFFEEDYNEARHAKKVAELLGTDHSEYYCSIKDAVDILPKLPDIWDEPIADSSMIPTTLVSLLARKQAKVCLSADGGDEIFGGYGKYLTVYNKFYFQKKVPPLFAQCLQNWIRKPIFQKIASNLGLERFFDRFNRTVALLENDPIKILSILDNIFLADDVRRLLKGDFICFPTAFDNNLGVSELAAMQAIDFKTYMVDDVLVKVDRASMSASLECREPLLDFRLIEFLAQLPDEYKIKNGLRKRLLKNIVHKYLPEEIMDRPKMGFGIPLSQWFFEGLREFMDRYLEPSELENSHIFNVPVIVDLKRRFFSGDASCFEKLWLVIVFEMWRKRWLS